MSVTAEFRPVYTKRFARAICWPPIYTLGLLGRPFLRGAKKAPVGKCILAPLKGKVNRERTRLSMDN